MLIRSDLSWTFASRPENADAALFPRLALHFRVDTNEHGDTTQLSARRQNADVQLRAMVSAKANLNQSAKQRSCRPGEKELRWIPDRFTLVELRHCSAEVKN